MAQTFASRRLRHERAMDARLTREHLSLARRLSLLVIRAATVSTPDRRRVVPDTRRTREDLKNVMWAQAIKPYYIGAGTDAFSGASPQSPYANLLYDGIAGATRIQVEAQVALMRRVIRDDSVFAWLTAPRPYISEQRGVYDPFHLFVDPAGYTLSDRVWRNAVDVRSRVDRLLDYHIARGDSAVDIAELLEDYLTPGARLIKTRTPYGREGSYAARRLARTEISAASGRATVNAGRANPFVTGIRWALSASHSKPDICDVYAAGGPAGDGVYPPAEVPAYPAHPHDLCNLQQVVTKNPAELVAELRNDIRNQTSRASRIRGIFNVEFLTQALIFGAEIVRRAFSRPAEVEDVL